jgi:hypothetical protein
MDNVFTGTAAQAPRFIESGLAMFPDIDGVHFGDDFGDQAGISMGPERWRAVMKPRLGSCRTEEWRWLLRWRRRGAQRGQLRGEA